VGQHAAFIRQQRSAKRAHRLASRNVFVVHGMGFGQNSFFDLGNRRRRSEPREEPLHPVDGPKQVHRRRPRPGEPRANPLKLRRKLRDSSRFGLLCAKRDAIGR